MRDVVLRPSGELSRFPHPDHVRHPGVMLARKVSERQLYLQVRACWPSEGVVDAGVKVGVPGLRGCAALLQPQNVCA